MNCSDFHQLLQQRLDGASPPARDGADRHLATCPECRAWQAAALRLAAGLRSLPSPVPPPGLAERVARKVLADRDRRLRFRWYRRSGLAAALAASVLVAAFAGHQWSGHPGPGTQEIAVVPPEPRPTPSLDDNVAEVGSALVGILNQTADRTLEPGLALLPNRVPVPPLLGLQAPLEPSMPSLQQASDSVASFGPVASVGKFVKYFRQDLPLREADKNQGL
jgi:predicted anti-sigma-YlaC factor YlaD